MGVVTDTLPDEASGGDTSPAGKRTDRSKPPDPFLNNFSVEAAKGDAADIAHGLTILKMLGDLLA